MRLLLLVLLVPLLAAAQPAPEAPAVRVRVLDAERPAVVTLRTVTGPLSLTADGRPVATVRSGERATLETAAGGVVLRAGSAAVRGRTVTVTPQGNSPFRIEGGGADRVYRGTLEASADEAGRGRPVLRLVNVIGVEAYVASVVPSEYPFPEIEGAKAQAVLARTYALKSRGKYGTHDLVDHVGSQVYRGVESETPTARRAAEATRGEVLTHGGALIEAVYSSSSGGHTADNDAVWDGPPLPYLRGRPDPYDRPSPVHNWQTSADRARVLRALSRHYGFPVTGLSVVETSREGRVKRVRLHGRGGRTEQGNRFRLALNRAVGRQLLKSTHFTVERRGGRYVFDGRGFGHGVGMSQYGAREQARQGRGYRDILAYYFTGVVLERSDAGALAATVPAGSAPAVRPMTPAPPRPVATGATRERARRVGW